eukprot:GHVT01087090.1.p1 GENE.GHVT01087090.1~~GHVT01087090.1.p1  ORF type:complete len:107 (-),score=4.12 GHVT01087090.1:1269-1589(-)
MTILFVIETAALGASLFGAILRICWHAAVNDWEILNSKPNELIQDVLPLGILELRCTAPPYLRICPVLTTPGMSSAFLFSDDLWTPGGRFFERQACLKRWSLVKYQ